MTDRVKLGKSEFLEVIKLLSPKIVFYNLPVHFFVYEGVLFYSSNCMHRDFPQGVIEVKKVKPDFDRII